MLYFKYLIPILCIMKLLKKGLLLGQYASKMVYEIFCYAEISTYEGRTKIFSAKLALERRSMVTPGIDHRNKIIVFTTNNVCTMGLNIPSNRLRCV